MTGADKNNLEYAGSVFTPCFATTLTSATLNQPLWLNLNYPLLPVFTNPSTFPQYQVSERILGLALRWPSTEKPWFRKPNSQTAIDSLVNFFIGATSDRPPGTRVRTCTCMCVYISHFPLSEFQFTLCRVFQSLAKFGPVKYLGSQERMIA